jgi:hypothetical protein
VARRRTRPRAAIAALIAAIAAFALATPGGAAGGGGKLAAYRGLATWVDIYDPKAWAIPEATVAAIADRGVTTIFLETGNYHQGSDLVRPAGLGRLVEAAHAQGLRIVAWYLPSFANPARDLRRSLAAIRFRSTSGERFDSFALDIESSLVKLVSRRNARLLSLSRSIRAAVGASYPLGAIIPSPRGMELKPAYWPGFPFRQLDSIYDVFVPMAYYTYHVHGAQAVHDDVARSIALIRAQTGNPGVPIHVIGGVADSSKATDVRGFLQAVADCRPLGYGLYDYFATKPGAWQLLTKPPVFEPGTC